MVSLEAENISLEKANNALNEKLSEMLKQGLRQRRMISYWKKGSKLNSQNSETGIQSHIADLNEQITCLQNSKLELEDKIKEFENEMEVKTLKVKEGRCYNENIRIVYEDLLCLGLSSRNVEKVIRVVINRLTDYKIDNLPKSTFAKYMLLEARSLAQMHVADELSNQESTNLLSSYSSLPSHSFSSNNTLHSDGTSKHGHSYTTFDIQKSDGKVFVAGLREVSGGDAETQLDLLKEVLTDIGSMHDDNSFVNKSFLSIKNLMSDRCATQKKFNNIFIDYRKSVLPQIIENWEFCSTEEKKISF